jgi:hypothetical protein
MAALTKFQLCTCTTLAISYITITHRAPWYAHGIARAAFTFDVSVSCSLFATNIFLDWCLLCSLPLCIGFRPFGILRYFLQTLPWDHQLLVKKKGKNTLNKASYSEQMMSQKYVLQTLLEKK